MTTNCTNLHEYKCEIFWVKNKKIRDDSVDSWFIPSVLRLIGLTSELIRPVVNAELTTKINDHESHESTRMGVVGTRDLRFVRIR